MGKFSNAEIIKGILERRSKTFLFLYEDLFPMVKKFILKNNGNECEAEDLFQDTIIIIFEKINSNNLKLTSSFKTYFFAISKYLWLQRRELFHKTILRDGQDDSWNSILESDEYLDYEEEKLFQDHFGKLDKECQKILEGYFEKRPFKEIADELNHTPGYIKKLKFNCKEKLYYSIINDPVFYELMDRTKDEALKPELKSKEYRLNGKNPGNLELKGNHENKKGNK